MSVNYSLTVIVVDKDTNEVRVPLKGASFNQWKNLSDLERFYDEYLYSSYDIPESVRLAVKNALMYETLEYKDSYLKEDVSNVKFKTVPGHTKSGQMNVVIDKSQLDGIIPVEVKIGEDNSNLVDVYESIKKTFNGNYYCAAEVARNKELILKEYKEAVARNAKLTEYVNSIDFLKITDDEVKQNIYDELNSVKESQEDWEYRLNSIVIMQGLLDVFSEDWHTAYLFINSDWDVVDYEE